MAAEMILQGLEAVPPEMRAAAATFGNFDGVHRGHRQILSETRAAARALDGQALAITFDPHPSSLVRGGPAPPILTPFPEKAELLLEGGADRVLLLRFTEELAAVSAEDFLERILGERLGARVILVGWDARFGQGGAGDTRVLEEWAERTERTARVVPPICRGGLPVSSSRIRSAVAEGRMALAEELLGRPFRLRGRVVTGEGIGRGLGYATANLELEPRLLPPEGIYASLTRRTGGEWLPSVTYLGRRPTFQGCTRVLETHLLRETEELYGAILEVGLLERLRGDRSFQDPRELTRQIARDVERSQEIHQRRGLQGEQGR